MKSPLKNQKRATYKRISDFTKARYSFCPENNVSNPPIPPFLKGGEGGLFNFYVPLYQ